MLQLNFRVEDRSGAMVLVMQPTPGAPEITRPASSAEVELWNALTRRFGSPVRESYIRVSEQDLVSMLMERDHMRRALADIQQKYAELLERTKAHEEPSDVQAEASEDQAEGRSSVKRGTVPFPQQ